MTSATSYRPQLRAVGIAVLLTIVAIAFGSILAVSLLIGYMRLTPAATGNVGPIVEIGVSLIALQGLSFPLVAWAYLRWRGDGWSLLNVSVPSLRDIGYVLGGFFASFTGLFIISIVLTALSVETAPNSVGETAAQNPGIIPLLVVCQFLLVGPGEELLFRGIIQGSLRERFSAGPAILLASMMFAPIHILALSGGLPAAAATIAILFVPSIVFGVLYEKTGNLAVPALTHGLYNGTLFGLTYLSTTVDAPELIHLF
ncbi:CPBP family intramembrane glutamic endopeptidase [Halobacterium salinarum]|uniref:Abi/CAAX domain protein n=4 Tax=Halobacterium salinarum TaxID=2242 RepID=Q9HS87_HALSA|nr:CPBP family intramembrane glutamic endopeptidase [Halobacterium salinarum]AAG18921.1 conserved hypothetical protein [Halobacterium salinarum NRC-1]MBB6089753.1 hypothetical protein [Halobacterium salinarum]MDL0124096.1 lysostaphin resistance A-like protein [Halobacterium salinarum]MDL0129361.1 lysostaphin resistance A-like protein [Halobacterium salinarum]MDL0141493.1 lysostaphin resistance A-like protein [Halobacterium salinarum]